jgi:hypothetical protein
VWIPTEQHHSIQDELKRPVSVRFAGFARDNPSDGGFCNFSGDREENSFSFGLLKHHDRIQAVNASKRNSDL